MPRVPITHTPNSSNIKHLEFHPDEERLIVTFHSGARHQYSRIHENTFDALVAAPSVGGFFHAHIRGGAGIESKRLPDAELQETR